MTPTDFAKKLECEEDRLFFTRYFFKQTFGTKMKVSEHHKVICDTLDKVYNCTIKRLIINVPPGYTKTLLAVINFIAHSLALNPRARFMHLSYSDDLALQNSSATKQIVLSEEFQKLWQIEIQNDAKSNKKWWTKENGGVYATSTGGQITGFRAGYMEPGFSGAIIVDDSNKPDDAGTVLQDHVNERFNNTIKSRLACEDNAIIVIMQRIDRDDLSGYLLRGGSGDTWHHLCLPAIIDNSITYPEEYTHGIEIKHGLKDGWLWPEKHNQEHAITLMANKKTWYSQYLQRPELYNIEGALFKNEWIDKYRISKINITDLQNIVVAIDPSGDDGKGTGDEIGIVVAGKTVDGHYYILADETTHGTPAQWGSKSIALYNSYKCDKIIAEWNYGGAMVEHVLKTSAGKQYVPFDRVNATRGKIVRAEPVASLYENGKVHHVGNLTKLENELTTYNGKGKSPNRMDALVWAIIYLSGNSLGTWSTSNETGL